MASYQEHLNKAKYNLELLEIVNKTANKYWDWQVTICFYVSVHLINAHLASKANLHYRSHEEVENAINPYTNTVLTGTKLNEQEYLCYMKLRGLSRRARYLCHEDKPNDSIEYEHLTHDKHFAKAVKKLDELMKYFSTTYTVEFSKINLDCIELKNAKLNYFTYSVLEVFS